MKRKTIFTFVFVAIAATVCFALDYILGTDGVFGGASIAFAALAGAVEEQTQVGTVNTHTIEKDAEGKATGVGKGPDLNKSTVSSMLS